jgi:GT2 family glycosyltransferase
MPWKFIFMAFFLPVASPGGFKYIDDMTDRPLVSIIVVNWNGLKTIQKCLDSLLGQSYPAIEVILVDNGSTDGSKERILSLYQERVRLIASDQNEGFAKGNNRGIEVSKGDYIALLNNDAWASPDWVGSLVKTAEKDRRTGMCASKILLAREDHFLDNTGHLIYPDGLSWGRGRMERDAGQYETEEEILLPSGCAALYKKEMLDETGLFDERFFAYCEDTDLGLRGRWLGWKCVYSPGAVVYHAFSASTSGGSGIKAFYIERNRGWVAIKNLPLFYLLLSPWYTVLRFFWQVYGLFKGEGMARQYVAQHSIFSGILLLFKSWRAVVAGFPEMFRERSALMKRKKISSKEMTRLIKKFQVSPKVFGQGKY